jgi:AraC-like DNA-binding protein
MEHVYRQRLESVRRDLLSPLLQDCSLAELAYSWGFRNYTHFSARFRSHFGLSPSAVRKHAIAVRLEPVALRAGRGQGRA